MTAYICVQECLSLNPTVQFPNSIISGQRLMLPRRGGKERGKERERERKREKETILKT